jgi:hypothetical protein
MLRLQIQNGGCSQDGDENVFFNTSKMIILQKKFIVFLLEKNNKF